MEGNFPDAIRYQTEPERKNEMETYGFINMLLDCKNIKRY